MRTDPRRGRAISIDRPTKERNSKGNDSCRSARRPRSSGGCGWISRATRLFRGRRDDRGRDAVDPLVALGGRPRGRRRPRRVFRVVARVVVVEYVVVVVVAEHAQFARIMRRRLRRMISSAGAREARLAVARRRRRHGRVARSSSRRRRRGRGRRRDVDAFAHLAGARGGRARRNERCVSVVPRPEAGGTETEKCFR